MDRHHVEAKADDSDASSDIAVKIEDKHDEELSTPAILPAPGETEAQLADRERLIVSHVRSPNLLSLLGGQPLMYCIVR